MLDVTKVYDAGETLEAAELNSVTQEIEDYINLQVLGPTGHIHDGTDSPQISYLNILDKPSDRNAFVFPITGALTVGSDKAPLLHEAWENATLVEARAVIRTGPTDADLILDINDDGTSIWNGGVNRLKIVAGQTSGNTVLVDNPDVVKGSKLTIDIDQVGSTIAGADVTVYLIYRIQLIS